MNCKLNKTSGNTSQVAHGAPEEGMSPPVNGSMEWIVS
jgi:hypothetical protein